MNTPMRDKVIADALRAERLKTTALRAELDSLKTPRLAGNPMNETAKLRKLAVASWLLILSVALLFFSCGEKSSCIGTDGPANLPCSQGLIACDDAMTLFESPNKP